MSANNRKLMIVQIGRSTCCRRASTCSACQRSRRIPSRNKDAARNPMMNPGANAASASAKATHKRISLSPRPISNAAIQGVPRCDIRAASESVRVYITTPQIAALANCKGVSRRVGHMPSSILRGAQVNFLLHGSICLFHSGNNPQKPAVWPQPRCYNGNRTNKKPRTTSAALLLAEVAAVFAAKVFIWKYLQLTPLK
jgi:hypothetical protein